MKLNVQERLMVMQVLPKEGNFATLRIVRRTQDKLGITDEEFKEFEIKQVENNITWNKKGNEEKEIQIGESATDLIIEALEKMDKENKLTVQHISIYEKFKEDKDGDNIQKDGQEDT